MAISFDGSFEVKQDREKVFEFLTDPDRFCPLLPDYQSHAVEDDNHFNVKVKVGISHIRGTAAMKLQLAESVRPQRAVYKGNGSVAGGNVSVTAGFDLSEMPGGTKVDWKGEAQIFGRLTSVAGGLLEPLGRKSVQKLIDGLQAALT